MTPLVFVSYAHEDFETAARLAEELQARGLRTWQDVKDIRLGMRIESEMEKGIASADAVLHLLTEEAIASAPVQREIALSTARRRRQPADEDFTVLIAARGLGDGFEDVGRLTLERFGENFTRDWLEILPAGAGPVAFADAAGFARKTLRGFFARGAGPEDGQWRFGLHTRAFVGDGHDLELDWRAILGTEDGRGPGGFGAWQRCWRAVCDVRDVLADHSSRRQLELDGAAHQTAAFLFGLAFCRNGRYRLAVSDQEGEYWSHDGAVAGESDGYVINLQPEDLEGTYLTIEIEVARRVVSAVSAQIAASGEEPRARLLATPRKAGARLTPQLGTTLAIELANQAKQAVDDLAIERIEIYLAAPVPFTVLFAAELGAVGPELALYEFHDGRYAPSLAIPEEER